MSTVGNKISKAKSHIREGFRVTTTRPVAILMIVLGVFVFGWQSYEKLPLDLMPEITYPSLTVRTEYPGAAPEEVENNIAKRIEAALAVVDNLVNISSVSKTGICDVVLEFTWKTDMNVATADVREKLDQVILPDEAKRPLILRYDPSLDPIMRIALSAEDNDLVITAEEMAMRLREYAENDIREQLEAIEGVAAIRVRGGLERELLIELDNDALRAKRIDPQLVIDKVQRGNINVAGGNLREGETEYQVRVLNEFRDLDTIRNLIIERRGSIDIRLDELANVRWEPKEREIYTRIDQQPSVEIQLFKEADANIVGVAQRVRDRIFGSSTEREQAGEYAKQQKQLTEGVAGLGDDQEFLRRPIFLSFDAQERGWNFRVLTDQSIFIRNSIDEVRSSALIGGVLAIIVLFLFLRSLKSTILIGITIPVSVVATFAPMMLFGVSLNIMSLGGLALGIGMLVDNSIVVLESIFRCAQEGDPLVEAVVRGTGEVGGAVIASTLTTVAVFFPIVFVEGIAGQIFGDMALAVVFSLLASLLCALFFIPMLASRRVPIANLKKQLIVAAWSLPSADALGSRIRAHFSDTQSMFSKTLAVVSLPVLAVWWFVLTIPGLLYDIFLRRGQSWLLLKQRLGSFWDQSRGFLGSSIIKIVLAAPHHLFFFILFFVDMILDFLGRPFISVVMTGERLRNYWIRPRGRLKKTLMVITAIPYHLYIFTVFCAHFLLEVAGRLIGLTLLVLFNLIRTLSLVLGYALGLLLKPILWIFGKIIDLVNSGYPRAISWVLNHKIVVVVIALALATHAGSLLFGLKANLIPEVHQGEFNVRIKAPVGTDIEKTNRLTGEVESEIRSALKAQSNPNEDYIYETMATVVGAEKTANTRADEGENTSVVTVRLSEQDEIQAVEDQAIERIRERLSGIPGLNSITFDRPMLFSFKTPIEVEVKGHDRQYLKEYSNQAVRVMESIEGLADVKNSIQPGNPEFQILYDRERLRLYGLDIRSTAQKVRDLVEGRIAGQFRRGDLHYDIRVRLKRVDIKNREDLEYLDLSPQEPKSIKLKDVAQVLTVEGPNEIRRRDQERTALITANIKDIDLRTATEQIALGLESERRKSGWQPDYRFEITGQTEEMEVSSNSLQWALYLAIFLVYIVMASQFESLLQPFIIIFTIPLAMVGVVYLLFLTETPLSIVVFIGMIMLAGIVVNNAIVLVDYINQLRSRGLDKLDAIIEAGRIRLRPILMTTLTTVLALLPLALGLGAGTEIRAPMAWTVIAGLLSSTLLTLFVIPTVYALIDRRKFAPAEVGVERDDVALTE